MNSPYKRLTFGICIIVMGIGAFVRAGARPALAGNVPPAESSITKSAADYLYGVDTGSWVARRLHAANCGQWGT